MEWVTSRANEQWKLTAQWCTFLFMFYLRNRNSSFSHLFHCSLYKTRQIFKKQNFLHSSPNLIVDRISCTKMQPEHRNYSCITIYHGSNKIASCYSTPTPTAHRTQKVQLSSIGFAAMY